MLARLRVWLNRQHDLHKACIFETLREYLDFNKKLDKKQLLKTAFQRRFWGWWILLATIIGLSVALSVYHDRIVLAIRPVAETIIHTPGAWAVPVAALILVSIPPLVGHEIIILIVGVIWGLWWGFLIAIAGTFLGEILTYYLFKYLLRERAKKIEAKSRLYAGLAHVMRRDGLWMISLVRFSYLPGHLVTCIQSTIGISVWVFGIACAISLPKQLALVYLGVLFGESHKLAKEGQAEQAYDEEQTSNTNHKIVSWTVLCVTGFLSVVAMYVIWFRMWQEEKRVAALSVSADESGINESKENLDEVEMQYTLPYLQFPSTERMNRERSSSYASTSASPPTFHTAGRPKMGRSRSSTLTSFAFSNNSLPYLPYTPMLDVQSSNFPMQNRNLPSPIPSAIVSLPSAVQEDDRDPFDEDRSTISSGSDRPYFASGTSQASTPAQSEVSVRARRIRLQRSTSNLLLRDVSSDTKIDMTGGTQIQPNPASASPGPQRMERAASPVGRQRARSRASSYLGPSASSYLGPSQSNVGEGPSQKSRPHPLSGQPSVDIDEPERSA